MKRWLGQRASLVCLVIALTCVGFLWYARRGIVIYADQLSLLRPVSVSASPNRSVEVAITEQVPDGPCPPNSYYCPTKPVQITAVVSEQVTVEYFPNIPINSSKPVKLVYEAQVSKVATLEGVSIALNRTRPSEPQSATLSGALFEVKPDETQNLSTTRKILWTVGSDKYVQGVLGFELLCDTS